MRAPFFSWILSCILLLWFLIHCIKPFHLRVMGKHVANRYGWNNKTFQRTQTKAICWERTSGVLSIRAKHMHGIEHEGLWFWSNYHSSRRECVVVVTFDTDMLSPVCQRSAQQTSCSFHDRSVATQGCFLVEHTRSHTTCNRNRFINRWLLRLVRTPKSVSRHMVTNARGGVKNAIATASCACRAQI